MDDLALRIGDSERWAVDARLQQAVGEGLLTLAEYEERAGQVWRSVTRADLQAVTADLPLAAPSPSPLPGPGPGPRPRRVLAVMSEDRVTGPIAPGQRVEAYTVMGKATLDLRREDLPAEVRVRVVSVMGEVRVLVPRGVAVQLSGLTVMGQRALHLDEPRPGAPVVRVDAYAVMRRSTSGTALRHLRRRCR